MTLSLCQLLEAVAAMILLCLSESQHISATGPYLKGQHMERHTAVSDEEAHCAADVSSSPQRIFIHRLVLAVHQLADVREEGDQIIWILKPAKLLHK